MLYDIHFRIVTASFIIRTARATVNRKYKLFVPELKMTRRDYASNAGELTSRGGEGGGGANRERSASFDRVRQ